MLQRSEGGKSKRREERNFFSVTKIEVFHVDDINWMLEEVSLASRTLHRPSQTATEQFNRFWIIIFIFTRKKVGNWALAWRMSQFIEHLKLPRATFSDKFEADYWDIESCWAFHFIRHHFQSPQLTCHFRFCLLRLKNIQFTQLVSKSKYSSLTANICRIIIQWYVWDGKLITFSLLCASVKCK